MKILHYKEVDSQNIISKFTDDKKHRLSLTIPFNKRIGDKYLCIIGQNPSIADDNEADKTIEYFEKFVFNNFPKYDGIVMLNLFSRIDTKKEYKDNLECRESVKELEKNIERYSDFLLAFGKKKKDKAYDFYSKLQKLKPLFKNKNLYKIDIGQNDYPPHPGNPKILYNKFNFEITKYIIE